MMPAVQARFKCQLCGKEFRYSQDYNAHMSSPCFDNEDLSIIETRKKSTRVNNDRNESVIVEEDESIIEYMAKGSKQRRPTPSLHYNPCDDTMMISVLKYFNFFKF